MVTESRREREIRDREAQILDIARGQILTAGYLGLNMDRIAAEMEYSKGTIYQHFRNKEEILLALANDAQQQRIRMFEAAANWVGRPRERLCAIGAAAEAFLEQYPHFFMVEQLVRSVSIWEKTSPERRELMRHCEQRCMAIVVSIVRDGITQGDLTLPPEVTPEDVVFGCWSMNWGGMIIATTSDSLADIGIAHPGLSLHHNMSALLDGYDWRPLSTEYDYTTHVQRVKQNLFPALEPQANG